MCGHCWPCWSTICSLTRLETRCYISVETKKEKLEKKFVWQVNRQILHNYFLYSFCFLSMRIVGKMCNLNTIRFGRFVNNLFIVFFLFVFPFAFGLENFCYWPHIFGYNLLIFCRRCRCCGSGCCSGCCCMFFNSPLWLLKVKWHRIFSIGISKLIFQAHRKAHKSELWQEARGNICWLIGYDFFDVARS